MTDLARYLDRIGFKGPTTPTLETLQALHRAHLLAVPYENLDLQFGRTLGTSPKAAFDKLVVRRRGGWCYEMNGVFAMALEAIGFQVTRIAGGGGRGGAPGMTGNHLVVLVQLDEPWIADVGFADGPRDPFPVRPHAFTCAGFEFRLEALPAGAWRLHNHAAGSAPYYDFSLAAADEALLAEVCQRIQTNPESPKRLNAIVIRHTPAGLLQLRGRVLRDIGPDGATERLIDSAEEYTALLRDSFDLDLPDAAALWPRITARHRALFDPS